MGSFTNILSLFTLLCFHSLAAVGQPISSSPAAAMTATPPSLLPPQSLLNAVETLSNSGYSAMGLTLEVLLAQPLFLQFPSLTIFAPPDSAFVASGQPSLSLLLLHFSPLSLSHQSLLSLPFSSPIPTLSPSETPLYITTPPSNPTQLSINNIKLSGSPIFDDGWVIVFTIEDFFSLNFSLPKLQMSLNRNPDCVRFSTFSRLLEASGVLKSRGSSKMAAFLELQLMGFVGSAPSPKMKLTVFAPVDEAMVGFSGNFAYSSLFLRHLLPCKLSWSELNGIANGTVFGKYVEGFSIKIEKIADNIVMVNGVKITAPDMYENDWIVIHGLRELIPVLDSLEEEVEESMPRDHGEF